MAGTTLYKCIMMQNRYNDSDGGRKQNQYPTPSKQDGLKLEEKKKTSQIDLWITFPTNRLVV